MTCRVLIVDDSFVFRSILSKALEPVDEIEIVGFAENGAVALEKVEALSPDVITLDVEMPVMDGIATLKKLEAAGTTAKVIMLSSRTMDGASATIEAMSHGASDFVVKPTGNDRDESMAKLRTSLQRRILALAAENIGKPAKAEPAADVCRVPRRQLGRGTVLAIGVSTGGPKALMDLLPSFPANFPIPILLVQHMPAGFTSSLAQSLARRCALDVREAEEGDEVKPGRVLIAPGGRHMTVGRGPAGEPVVRLDEGARINSCRPSVDRLFDSVAEQFGDKVLGVILTGMGEDGVEGSRTLKGRGATVLAQDESSSVVWGMPRRVVEEGLADRVLSIGEMTDLLPCLGSGGLL